jgi:hypothetical protein
MVKHRLMLYAGVKGGRGLALLLHRQELTLGAGSVRRTRAHGRLSCLTIWKFVCHTSSGRREALRRASRCAVTLHVLAQARRWTARTSPAARREGFRLPFRLTSWQRAWKRETDVDPWRRSDVGSDKWVAISSKVRNARREGQKPRVKIEEIPQGVQIPEEMCVSRRTGARGDTRVAILGEV